jgi:cation diffusion facilitator CzcD-associated flavoprotein CzcO
MLKLDRYQRTIARVQRQPREVYPVCLRYRRELNKRFTLVRSFSTCQRLLVLARTRCTSKAKIKKVSRDLVAEIMSEQLGHDPRLTKQMIPDFALGCRRMTPWSSYLQSLRAPNVEVVTESVTKLTEDGIVDESDHEYKVDVVVFATGFDTSFTPHFEVIGRNGANLREQFGDFPKGYLGITAPNFPNLFRESPIPATALSKAHPALVLVGPNSPASRNLPRQPAALFRDVEECAV